MRLPSRLEASPLVDALFEVRFSPIKSGTGELLPGVLFSGGPTGLPGDFGPVERLPISQVPVEFRERDPNVRYMPHYRTESDQAIVQVGDRVVSVAHKLPYPGWARFSELVWNTLEILVNVPLVNRVERFSFRFINLIEGEPDHQLENLVACLEVGGEPLLEEGLQIRFERNSGPHRSIVHLAPRTTAQVPSLGQKSGLIVDVDTIRRTTPEEFWDHRQVLLNDCHVELKRVFFSLVRDSVVESWGPSWEAES